MADVVPVAEAGLKLQKEVPPQVALAKLQAERAASFSASCTSLEGTIADRESSVTQLCDGLRAFQTHVANI